MKYKVASTNDGRCKVFSKTVWWPFWILRFNNCDISRAMELVENLEKESEAYRVAITYSKKVGWRRAND